MILNLEESVDFFAIWPGIAPYLCTGAALTLFEWGGVSDLLPTVVWSFCRVISL